MPKISVIIPVYNRRESLRRALASVLAQSFQDFEVVIVDDGSKPQERVADDISSDPRVRVTRHASNRGPSAARNTGVALAQGTWLAFLDSDDVWLPEKLIRQLEAAEEALRRERGPIAVVSGFVLEKRWRSDTKALIPRAIEEPFAFYRGVWFCPGTTLFISVNDFRQVGLFDEALKRLEDLEWSIRFSARGGKLVIAKSVLARVAVGGKPSSHFVADAAGQLVSLLRAKELLPSAAERVLAAYLDLEIASSASFEGKYLRCLNHLVRSWWQVPRARLHLATFWDRVPDAAPRARTG